MDAGFPIPSEIRNKYKIAFFFQKNEDTAFETIVVQALMNKNMVGHVRVKRQHDSQSISDSDEDDEK